MRAHRGRRIAEPAPRAELAGYRFTGRTTLPVFSETLVVDSYAAACPDVYGPVGPGLPISSA